MCAIAGIIGSRAKPNLVARMIEAQSHRGPDGEGVWSKPGVALGHKRLKVIDLTDAGKQPMSTPDGRYTLVYNGEVYNYRQLRKQIPNAVFRSRTDSEVVLWAYAHWGPKCLEHFVGMFALAIWDDKTKELFCARDRIGVKPFYYAMHENQFIFSSEIRGILASGVPRIVNDKILYQFLAQDYYEHADETFFKGIFKLPPANWMIIKSDQRSAPQRYWDLAADSQKIAMGGTIKERQENLIDLCADAVDLHLRSDVPVAVALSGGLDSATLLALLTKIHPDLTVLEAFSFSFSEEKYSERPYVEAMAKHANCKAHFVEISPEMFAESSERFTISQEEPFAGAPISAYALCFEMIRSHDFIVVMDGSGIDEALAGYSRFLPAFWADLFLQGDMEGLDKELTCCGVISWEQRRLVFEQIHQAMQPLSDMGKGQDLTSSVRPDTLNQEYFGKACLEKPNFERPFSDNLHNLMYRELRYTKLPRALRFRDRLSMAVGTELRPPFLDHRVLAYAFALPAHDLINGGVQKFILRNAASKLLPDVMRFASKRSVQTPQREWMRNELKSWVQEKIDTPRFWERGWINQKNGLEAMNGFFNGNGDNSFFLWQWINLEMWAEAYLDKMPSGVL